MKSLTGVSGRVTQLLAGASDGKTLANELLSLVYMELHAIARNKMIGERPNHTLSPTALVNEAYLRLMVGQEVNWQNRRHFFSAASEAMRRILIDSARKKNSQKHGGLFKQLAYSEIIANPSTDISEDFILLDSALDKLQLKDKDLADVVKLKFFSGLSNHEVALALDTSERSINRMWMAARAWLLKEMK